MTLVNFLPRCPRDRHNPLRCLTLIATVMAILWGMDNDFIRGSPECQG
jgi:hypothetical protein